jgi:hypothetical protein
LPEDTTPLLRLIDALGRDEIDVVAFTTASQASNLFAVDVTPHVPGACICV